MIESNLGLKSLTGEIQSNKALIKELLAKLEKLEAKLSTIEQKAVETSDVLTSIIEG